MTTSRCIWEQQQTWETAPLEVNNISGRQAGSPWPSFVQPWFYPLCALISHLTFTQYRGQETCRAEILWAEEKTMQAVPVTPAFQKWSRQIPGAHWPSSLTKTLSFQFSERQCLKTTRQRESERSLCVCIGTLSRARMHANMKWQALGQK